VAKRPSMISRHGVDFNVDQGDPVAQGFAQGMQQWVDRPSNALSGGIPATTGSAGRGPASQTYRQEIWSPPGGAPSGRLPASPGTGPANLLPPRVLTPEQYLSSIAGSGSLTGISRLAELSEDQASFIAQAQPRTPIQAAEQSFGAGAVQSLSRWDIADREGRLNPETGRIEPGALTEEELAILEAPPGMIPYKKKEDGTWEYIPKTYDDLGQQVALRAAWGHDVDSRVQNLIAANPSLASTALEAGMSMEDLADIENMLAAQTTANLALDAVMMNNDSRARQLLTRQSPEMALVSLAIFTDTIDKAQKAYQEAQESGENIAVQIGSFAWNALPGPIFDFLIAAWELAQQVIRTTAMTPNALEGADLSQPGGFSGAIMRAWQQTTPGYLDPEGLQNLRSEFGERETNIVVEAYLARTYGDDDALDQLFNTYANDQEALNIIFNALSGTRFAPTADQDDFREIPKYDVLYREVAGLDQGNTGNLFARSAGLDPMSFGFGQTRDVVNIATIFADPTIIGAKARGVYMFNKYGIHLMAGTANLTKSFNRSNVRRWFDNFGSQVETISKITDSRARGEAVTRLLAQEKRFANAATVEIALKYNLRTADDFFEFLTGMETVEKILVGNSAVLKTKASSRRGPRKGRKAKDVTLGGGPIYKETTTVSENAPEIVRLQKSFIQSQGARRYGQVYTPHMSAATEWAKVAMRATRTRVDVPGRILSQSTPALDDVLGKDFSSLSREDQIARLTVTLQDDAAVAVLGRELGDFTGRRTVVGRLVDRATEGATDLRNALGLNRKGNQRKGLRSEGIPAGVARKIDRWSRFMARMPDSSRPINWATAEDADRIYQLMRRGGVHRGAASEFRAMWIEMNEAQRRLAYVGLIKTYGRAAGVDLVDPKNGMANLLEGITGVRTSELHAANQIPRFGALMREVRQEAEEAAAAIAKNRGGVPLTSKEVRGIETDILARRIVEGEFQAINPSMSKGDLSSAVWIGQTSDQGFFPNIAALDNLTARSSYLNALLFNNRAGAGITDWWVLGTLGGADFQLRNAVEEIGLYALTGGKFGAFLTGRQISTGIREGSERSSRKLIDARAKLLQAQNKLEKAVRSNATDYQVQTLESRVRDAADNLSRAEARYGGRGKKLGIVKTSSRKAAAAAAQRLELQGRQNAADSLRAWFLPYLSKDEVAQARRAFETGDMTEAQAREFVAELQSRAVARQFLTMVRDPDAKGILADLRRGVPRSEMNERQQQVLNWVDDLVRSPAGLRYQDRAAETSRHFADGVMPMPRDMGDSSVSSEGFNIVTFKGSYESEKLSTRVSAKEAEAVIIGLSQATGDGPRGQAALRNLKKYWYAVNKTPGGPDTATMDDIIGIVVRSVDESTEGVAYRARLSFGQSEDPTDIARRPLDTLVGMFTTPDGNFNEELWRALQVKGDDGSIVFKLYDKTGDEVIPRITLDDFAKGKYDPPANTLALNVEEYVIPAKMDFRDWAWSAMGRSFARMVREPIFGANYIDARQTFLPFEREWARVLGDKQAKRLATEAASERAFQLTMAYGDNPAVRSQMAWEVRNVARFYRAVEDFGRRMWRTGKNNPLAFWKASLAWNATLDSGWVYEDEFGEPYFVYPGSKAAISVMNDVLNIMGVGQKIPELDMGIAGRVKFITPSADPEAWVPTLSGVWASFLYRPMLRSLPAMDGLNKDIERIVFGSISADQTLSIDGIGEVPLIGEMVASIPSSLPPIINKLAFGVAASVFSSEVPGSFSSRMVQKAALAMAANGDSPPANMSDKEQQEYLSRLDATALGLSLMSIAFGLIAPSAPQVFAENTSEFAKQMGILNLRPGLMKFIQQQSEQDVPYEVALAKWISDNPGRGVVALSANEMSDWGYVQATEGNLDFIRSNEELWNEMPTGMTFFMPNSGLNNIGTFKTLSAMGYSKPKLGSKYALELVTQEGYIRYITSRGRYREVLADPNASDEEKSSAEASMSDTTAKLEKLYPGLDRRIRGQGRDVKSNFEVSVREAIAVAEILAGRGDQRAQAYLDVAASYNSAKNALANIDRLSADYDRERSIIKRSWDSVMWNYSQRFPNDEQWSNLMYHTTKALSDSWTVPVVDPDRESQ